MLRICLPVNVYICIWSPQYTQHQHIFYLVNIIFVYKFQT